METIKYFKDYILEVKENYKKTSVVLIFNKDDEILIIKRSKTAPWMPNKWSLVGGGVEKNENYLDAAIREVKEETSLKVSSLKKIDEVFSEKENCNIIFYQTNTFKGDVKLNFENSKFKWVNKNDYNTYEYVPDVKNLIEKHFKII